MKAIAFIKKYARAGIALMAVLGFSSFKMLSDDWYEFTGDDPKNGSHYELVGNSPNNCETGSQVCAIRPQSLDEDGNPVIDATMEAEINLATSQQSSTTNVKVRN